MKGEFYGKRGSKRLLGKYGGVLIESVQQYPCEKLTGP
jgi:hypothetical protein